MFWGVRMREKSRGLKLTDDDRLALRWAGGPVFRAAVVEVSSTTRVPPAAILSDTRVARVVRARDAVVALLRRAGWSSPRIGRALRRDHTSVLAAARRHAARLQEMEASR